jgi:hypothetical protein
MIRRFMVVIAALLFASAFACSAFDHSSEPYEGFNPSEVPLNPFLAAGPYEGVYTGTMTLESVDETCVGVAEAVGDAVEITLDVLQAGELVSIMFKDGVEENGKLVNDKVTVVKREASDTRMYHLQFGSTGLDEEASGVSGTVEVFVGDEIITPCAKYSCNCHKGE